MAFYARVLEDLVVEVIEANEKPPYGEVYVGEFVLIDKPHYYFESIKVPKVTPGTIYDAEHDEFISPQPYPSWIYSFTQHLWIPPVHIHPNDGKQYLWNEKHKRWTETGKLLKDLIKEE